MGGGLEQLRLLRDRPPPQLRSHQDQGLQRDQPPGTEWAREGLHQGSGSGRDPQSVPRAWGEVPLEMEGPGVGWGTDATKAGPRNIM